jgi:dipeptidyl-peptidase-4
MQQSLPAMKRLIYSSCLLFSFFISQAQSQLKPVTLNDIYNKPIFQTASISGIQFMRNGHQYTETDSRKNILIRDTKTGSLIDTILKADRLIAPGEKKLEVNSYRISENMVFIFTQVDRIFRSSYTCIPWLYDLRKQKLQQLSATPVMNITLSPDGSKAAYVRGENIFYRDLENGEEVQVTTDGQQRMISNGKSDWVYEETFSLTQALIWDAASTNIAYYRFDMRSTPMMTYPLYESSGERREHFFYRYYRAGDSIASVSIKVYNLQSRQSVTMNTGNPVDQYIPKISWAGSGKLAVYKMPRKQDSLDILLCDAATGIAQSIYRETSPQYVDKNLFSNHYFIQNGAQLVLMHEQSGWRHLYLYDVAQQKARAITSGEFDVDKIVKIDQSNQLVYFTAAYHSATDRQLFSSRFDGGGLRQITNTKGWHNPVMDATSSYFIDAWSTVNTPPVYTIHHADGKFIRELKNNNRLVEAMKNYDLPHAQFLQVMNRKGIPLNAMMIKPTRFDSTKQYPVLFMNYGGPGSQKVTDQWGSASFWQRMLASEGYVVVCIDNTGTGFRGAAFKKETYGNLGMKELQDQMDAARWLTSKYTWVMPSRIGYWGWSFGGFMSSLAITLGADYFSTAIAVAPVTDWRLYQAGYAERYMGLVKENTEGYERVSPINHAAKLKGKFLLIHGTGDDNVQFRNSVLLSKALMEAGKSFEQQYYPDKDHAINGGNTSFYLYSRMTDFIRKNL